MQELEHQSQIIKDAHKATKEARKERDHYKGLAGMYQLTYDSDTQLMECEMILQGIYVELQSDLLQFQIKNGNNNRVKKSQARLDMMRNQIIIMSAIQTTNFILKAKLREMEKRDHLQWEEICELKNRLNPTEILL